MHPCLEIDCVLQNIISRLSLFKKVTLLSLNVGWRKVVLVCLRQQRSLVTTAYQREFYPWDVCHEHTINKDNLIRIRYHKLDTWNVMVSWFPFLESICFDLRTDRDFNRYSRLFKLLLSTNAKTLKCVSVLTPSFPDQEPYPMVDSLPELKHWITYKISVKGIENIIKVCPKMQRLRCWSNFSEWHLLPKGMKHLATAPLQGPIMGLDNILKSDFVPSLETLEGVLMTTVLSSIPFTFASLKRLEVVIEEDANGCLYNLSRILRNCPVLEIFKIDMFCFDVIDKESWASVINECSNVTHFKISGSCGTREDFPHMGDYVLELIVSGMKKIETLELGFDVSSKGLLTLEKLKYLKSFGHSFFVRRTEYTENADALLRFFNYHFAKNMKKYEMYFKLKCSGKKKLILPESFLSSIEKMESELSVKFRIYYNLSWFRNKEPQPENFPRLIYLEELSAEKVTT